MPFFDLLREDSKKCEDDDCIIDIILDSYRNVSYGFKSSEKVIRKAVARYFEIVEQGYDDEFDIKDILTMNNIKNGRLRKV